MQHNSLIRIIYLYLFALTVFLIPALCFADNPRVTSVTANPPAIDSGYMTALSWTIDGSSSGSNLYFTCIRGVKITNPEGTVIPCNTRYSTIFNVSGSIGLKLTNISGSTVSMPVRVYPRDANGTDYDLGAMDTYININAVQQLVPDFTATTTNITANTLTASTIITLNWTGPYLDGVNFQFVCTEGVKIFESGNLSTQISCGTLAFADYRPGSGSASFTFIKSSESDTKINVIILPMIVANSYDAMQSKTLQLDIAGKTLPKPISVNSFTVSKQTVSSGEPLNFSWDVVNASGVNLQIVCNSAIAAANSQSTSTADKLRCGIPAFDQTFPLIASTTLYFTNNSTNRQNLSIFLLPHNPDGIYNGPLSKIINIIVMPPGQPAQTIAASTIPVITPVSSTSTSTSANTGIKAAHTVTFTQYLYKTSRATQVKSLQEFLAQDKTLYPEGLITGYFGSLTERAIWRFQEKYNIAKKGDEGYGIVGPKTRAKLNSLDRF